MSGVLTEDERGKVREMFLACTPNIIQLTSSVLSTLEATAGEQATVLDRSLLIALVQSWNPATWEAAIPALAPNRRDAFKALLLLRFNTARAAYGGASQNIDRVWQWATRRF